MEIRNVSKILSGVIAAVATPVTEDGSPDFGRAVKLARFLLDNGCDGLNVLGTTGEATSFSLDERKAVMDAYKANGMPLHRLKWMPLKSYYSVRHSITTKRRNPFSRCAWCLHLLLSVVCNAQYAKPAAC